jgi:hypothetical protein
VLLCVHNDKPVVEAHVLIRYEREATRFRAIRTKPGKARKRIRALASLIDSALVREPLPFEAAAFQLDPVTFIRDAGRLIETFVIGACGYQQRKKDQGRTKKNHDSGFSGVAFRARRVRAAVCL